MALIFPMFYSFLYSPCSVSFFECFEFGKVKTLDSNWSYMYISYFNVGNVLWGFNFGHTGLISIHVAGSFTHMTILQQTTLNIFWQKIGYPLTKSGKHYDKRRNWSFWAISSFVTVFKKLSAADTSESFYMRKRVKVK